ncbi:MAG: tRNA (N(6)-L-threonylcarbamoyladenosine(37)-C(2))-methylthiotransferase MtaB [Anaerolineae bacterium]
MRIYLGSLGCKLNQSEMDALAIQLAQAGHQIVGQPGEATLCIFNTCAVTHVAAQKSRQALRRLHRENPSASLIVTGCYAELSPEEVQDLPGVEWVIGNRAKELLGERIGNLRSGVPSSPVCGPSFPLPHFRTRAFVKIQDGCDNACSYCVIRLARGPQRSRPADQVLDEVRMRLAVGYQEVVLTGVHIGAYGADREGSLQGLDLWGLITRILAETNVPRLRLSSIEPWDLSERAFSCWDDGRLCRHLHLPLQSGCTATLQRMARRYTAAEFAAWVSAARAAIPGLAVTTDVIVGFPGETEEEFAESLQFVEALGFARVHVFPYSPRPGTPAAEMPHQVPASVKAERARVLHTVAVATARAFARQFVGQTVQVLWESASLTPAGLLWKGLTDNYLRVFAVHPAALKNTFTPVRLVAVTETGLQGEIIA